MMTDKDRDSLRFLQDKVIRVLDKWSWPDDSPIATEPSPVTLADIRTTLYPRLAPNFQRFIEDQTA